MNGYTYPTPQAERLQNLTNITGPQTLMICAALNESGNPADLERILTAAAQFAVSEQGAKLVYLIAYRDEIDAYLKDEHSEAERNIMFSEFNDIQNMIDEINQDIDDYADYRREQACGVQL